MSNKNDTINSVIEFAIRWNKMFKAGDFEGMKDLATIDVEIANSQDPNANAAGMIVGRQAYYDGIYGAYSGDSGNEQNQLVMDYENWEYLSVGNDENYFYTIGMFEIFSSVPGQPNTSGVNCWLLYRESLDSQWMVRRVINTQHTD